ncbi:hypothetical protein HBH98_080440 [Parastagonospora nodorum]|nr:hypothetical protein HBH51_086730 [Parastagonospora nodorum]KAH4001378.1 hypothetical protein HBI10_087740 [Parastagonospora nodorum]KAH4027278.1 hypothetical protein HBI13_056760 [Parastagonospora nodorum]KAH4035594.1 hypothetical protein HBI09_088980 [Parastagonospora nodorum]KAH4223197.1 hypothetical protein HBI06_134480 [Parastagonospora nodorum]
MDSNGSFGSLSNGSFSNSSFSSSTPVHQPHVQESPEQGLREQTQPRYNPPQIGDYINNLIDHNVAEEDWRDERCAICQHEFGTEDGPSTSATNPDSGVSPAFRMAPCKHLFHVTCILNYLQTTEPNRNRCPLCRAEMCQTGIPRPETVARMQSMYESIDGRPWWNEANYAAIIAYVDEQFALQGPGDAAHFVPIPRMALDWWVARGDAQVSWEQRNSHGRWIEMMAAMRLHDLIRYAHVQHTWPGINFMWLCHGIHREYTRLYGQPQPQPQPQPLGGRTSPDRRSEDQISIGSTASTVRDDEVQELGLEAATQAAETRATRSHRNQDRRDNRVSSRPLPPRPADDGPRIGIHQMFAYLRAEEARNSQNNDELVPADRSTTDEQAVVEDADDVFRIERPLLPENQVFDEEYADTDSPGHSDDDGSDDDAPATIPSSDNAPSLTQTTESENDK